MAAQPLALEETCIMCPRRGPKICSDCKDARYCSKDCQKLDWKIHKIICPSFKEPKPETTETNVYFTDAEPSHPFLRTIGSVDFRRVLLFPGGDQPPRFVWIKTWVAMAGYDNWDERQIFGSDGRSRLRSLHNSIQSRATGRHGYELALYIKDDATREEPNIAARAFTRSGTCSSYLRGPIIVTCVLESRANTYMRDVDMRLARNAADYFSTAYRYPYPDAYLKSQPYLGTRVAFCEDLIRQNVTGNDGLHVFTGCDAIFMADSSGISNLLGIPILVRPNQIPDSMHIMLGGLWDDEDEYYYGRSWNRGNVAVELLMRNVTSNKAGNNGFGSVPRGCKRAKTVWAVRADGLPLPHQHLEALISYIRDKFEPRITESLSGIAEGDTIPSREAVLNSITRADFEEYFNSLKATKAVDEPGWALIPSPYAMKKDFIRAMKSLTNELWAEQELARLRL